MWKDLTLQQKAEIMKMSVANGVTDINDIRALYDGQVEHEFKRGGRVITIGELPEGFVKENEMVTVRDINNKTMSLKDAFAKSKGTHINTEDVPGLTDYLIRQDHNGLLPERPKSEVDFATAYNQWKEDHPTLNTIANYTPFVSTIMDGLELYTDPSWGNLGWFATDLASDIFSLGLAKGVTTGGKLINKALKGSKTITGRSRYIDWDKTSKIPLGDVIEGGDKIEKYGKQTFYQGTDLFQNHLQNTIQDDNTELSLGGHLFKGGGYISSKSIRDRISKWEGSSMYAPAPDTGKVNRPFSAEERDFWRVIPDDIKPLLTQDMADALFSTSYNIGAGNFKKRVVPQLRKVLIDGTGTVEDITNSMYGTRDKEPKMKGLRTRRATERKLFTDAYNTAYLNNVPQVDSNALYTPAQELRWNKPISQPTFQPMPLAQTPMQITMPRVETTPITPIEERVPISDTLPDISPLLLSLPDQQVFTPHRMVTPQYQPVNLNLDSPYLLFRS